MPNRFLIYTIANYTKQQVSMIRYMLKSLSRYTNVDAYDLLIVTNRNFQDHIASWNVSKRFNLLFSIHNTDKTLEDEKMKKIKIFDYFPDVKNYDKVLYLDYDCVVEGDIVHLFKQAQLAKGRLYPYPEDRDLTKIFYGLQSYSEKDLMYFEQNGIAGFSTGVFMFKPSREIATHFLNVQKEAMTFHGQHFYEQSFMNHYFNKKRLANTSVLAGVVKSRNIKAECGPPMIRDSDINLDVAITHFCGIGYYKERLMRMRRYYRMIKHYKRA